MTEQNKEVFDPDNSEVQNALNVLSGLVRDKLISVKEAAKRAGITEEEFVERTGIKEPGGTI